MTTIEKERHLGNLQASYRTIGHAIIKLWDLSDTLPHNHSAEVIIRRAEKAMYDARIELETEITTLKKEIERLESEAV